MRGASDIPSMTQGRGRHREEATARKETIAQLQAKVTSGGGGRMNITKGLVREFDVDQQLRAWTKQRAQLQSALRHANRAERSRLVGELAAMIVTSGD